jgi:N-acetyl-anhydromuramyl-L-alanine amidase AmpD
MEYKTIQKTKKKRKSKFRRIILIVAACFLLLIFGKLIIGHLTSMWQKNRVEEANAPDWVDVQIIPIDGDSRTGEKLRGIKDIVIHYVGNPGTTAQQNHDYYGNPDSEVSSHFIVGLDGEIIQCVPLNEKSAASNWRNIDTVSIEVCHPDSTGEFTEQTYASLVKLTAWLSELCNLDTNHIIRHYDITGKNCPLYFVEHQDKWEQFKEDVNEFNKFKIRK